MPISTNGVPISPGGGGFGSGGGAPSWLGPLLGVVGGIFQGIGRNKNRQAGGREDTRLEDETRKRARAKAVLMRGILNASGYGGMITDEQMVDLLTRTERRGNTEGGLFGDIGAGLGGVGSGLTLGQQTSPTPTPTPTPGGSQRSAEFWRWLDESMQGGAPSQPAIEGFGAPTNA